MISNIEELEKQDKVKTYSCGSQRLCHAIEFELGLRPINIYKTKNGKIINVFILSKRLSEFLEKWTKNKPKGVQNG